MTEDGRRKPVATVFFALLTAPGRLPGVVVDPIPGGPALVRSGGPALVRCRTNLPGFLLLDHGI